MTGTVTAVSAGDGTSCAVTSGAAWCWGDNSMGFLGDGGTTNSPLPVPVVTSTGMSNPVDEISTSTWTVCAATTDGNAWCWGSNGAETLGNENTADSSTPVQVSTASGMTSPVTTISVGGYSNSACVVTADGSAWCWGSDWYAQLGDRTVTTAVIPVRVDLSPDPNAPVMDHGGDPVRAASSTATGEGTVIVDGSIQIVISNVDKAFTLEGLSDSNNVTSVDDGISYTVTTNNPTGYSVAVQSSTPDLHPDQVTGNDDVVSFSDIRAAGTPSSDPALPDGGTSTGGAGPLGSSEVAVYDQTSRSKETGDSHRVVFTATIPFVNADTYTGLIDFIAVAN